MAESINHADQSIFTWQLPLADLCKQLDLISSSKSNMHRFIERSIIPETDLEVNQYDRSCPICQEPYHQERPAKLPCGHVFGHRCAARWLKQAKSCPTCRTKLVGQKKSSYNLSILHPDRLEVFRSFLLFVIGRHGAAKGASLDRDFQALIRSRPKSPPEIDLSAAKVPLYHEILWRRIHNWERKRKEFNASWLPKHHEDPCFEDRDPWRTFEAARASDNVVMSWFSEFGMKTDLEAWQTLRCRRMLRWLRGPWDGYEMEFLGMAVSQITDRNLAAFIRNRAIDFSSDNNPSSPWRLMNSRDYLEYRPREIWISP